MSAVAIEPNVLMGELPARPSPRRLLGLYLLLGFAAGLPFYMFNAVLTLRLSRHGVDIERVDVVDDVLAVERNTRDLDRN